jgi:putative transposase
MTIPLIYQEFGINMDCDTELFYPCTENPIRTEQIHIPFNENISSMCHSAKNLYNQINYEFRQIYFWNQYNPEDKRKMPAYCRLAHEFKDNVNSKSLYSSTAQWVIKSVCNAWNAYFKALKDWKINPEKYAGKPKIPGYKEKDGEYFLIFTNQACGIQECNGIRNVLTFPPKTEIEQIETRLDADTELKEVRIVPQGVGYNIEIVHKETSGVDNQQNKENMNNIVGIDLGTENILTIGNNIGLKPIVVKGSILKSVNQFYNKRRSELTSIYDRQSVACKIKDKKLIYNKNGRKLVLTTRNRNLKTKDIMHKLSRFVVNWCSENHIGTIVIGKNLLWKQESNMSKVSNQNFVTIPHDKLIQKIIYKANTEGITVITANESHTSKCSFLDNESIEHHNNYAGKRIKRGLFKSATGKLLNADVNGALNIIRKVFPNVFNSKTNGIAGTLTFPLRLSIKDLLNTKVSL